MLVVFSGNAVAEDEIQAAEDKFEESKSLAETAMFNLLENDVRTKLSIIPRHLARNITFFIALEMKLFSSF